MLAASEILASAVTRAGMEALKSSLRRDRGEHGTLEVNGEAINLPDNPSDEQLEEIVQRIGRPQAGGPSSAESPARPERAGTEPKQPVADALSRRIVVGADQASFELPPGLGGIALDSSPEFYAVSRQRIALAFRLSVGLSVTLAFILFGGIAATIVSGLMGHAAWSATFGGVSGASLLGIYAYKPLAAISEAVVASQRLEIINARLANQLMECAQQADLDKRIRCQDAVWDAVQKEISAMSATAAKGATS
jgi:hypothetical protein